MAGGSKANLNPAVWLHRLSSQLLLRGHMHQVDEMVRTEVREPPTESAASHAYPMRSGASFLFVLFCFVSFAQNEQSNYPCSFNDCWGLYLLALL